ncbi:MAG: META domain-containing protein [Paludibacteraceae bacterium]|jgi:heat shock protein HslJ|nr:META domain-containing protein [Paludibacteraceae bacterium]
MKKTLFFVALMATTLMACNKHTYNAHNVFGEWDLTQMNGQKIELAEGITTPFIGFDQNENRVYGNAGCNSFFGMMVTDSTNVDALRFDNMGSTRMLCANMEMEDGFLAALGQVQAIEYNADQLQLKDANGNTILLFVRK